MYEMYTPSREQKLNLLQSQQLKDHGGSIGGVLS